MAELSEKELLLYYNRYGINFNIKNGEIDSTHHSYKKKSRIKNEYEFDEEETLKAFEQFKKDLDED